LLRFSKSHIEYIKDDIGENIYVVHTLDSVVRLEYRNSHEILDEIYKKFITLAEYKTIDDKEDFELYLEYLINQIKNEDIVNKKIVVACSMGKDSAAGFIILYELWNRGILRYSPLAVFTYMPILEDPIIQLADNFISKFGEFLYIIHVPKSEILEKLTTTGYPTLQEKWCRAIKMGTIKKFLKKFSKDSIVYAECERIFESIKRLRSLYGSRVVFPRKINPVLYLSESDVFKICKMYNIVHGLYNYGASRTSCMLCPYASNVCHIQHIHICEKLGIDISPLIKSLRKLVNYYRDIGLGEYVKNEYDVIKYGLFSYRHTREDALNKIKFIDNAKYVGIIETIEDFSNRSRRYFYEYLEKVEYIPIWKTGSWRRCEKIIRDRAKVIIKLITNTIR